MWFLLENNMKSLTSKQRVEFEKILYCANRVHSGCDSAMETSIFEFHVSNGLILGDRATDRINIMEYVRANF